MVIERNDERQQGNVNDRIQLWRATFRTMPVNKVMRLGDTASVSLLEAD